MQTGKKDSAQHQPLMRLCESKSCTTVYCILMEASAPRGDDSSGGSADTTRSAPSSPLRDDVLLHRPSSTGRATLRCCSSCRHSVRAGSGGRLDCCSRALMTRLVHCSCGGAPVPVGRESRTSRRTGETSRAFERSNRTSR